MEFEDQLVHVDVNTRTNMTLIAEALAANNRMEFYTRRGKICWVENR